MLTDSNWTNYVFSMIVKLFSALIFFLICKTDLNPSVTLVYFEKFIKKPCQSKIGCFQFLKWDFSQQQFSTASKIPVLTLFYFI